MAQTREINLKHQFIKDIKLEPVKPVYELKPFISGWFLGFKTEYKNVLVSHDGMQEVITCSICGLDEKDNIHDIDLREIDIFELMR